MPADESDNSNPQVIKVKSGFLTLLLLIVAVLGAGGSVIAYTEGKFATKESISFQSQRIDNETKERRDDKKEITEAIRDLGKKIDSALQWVPRR